MSYAGITLFFVGMTIALLVGLVRRGVWFGVWWFLAEFLAYCWITFLMDTPGALPWVVPNAIGLGALAIPAWLVAQPVLYLLRRVSPSTDTDGNHGAGNRAGGGHNNQGWQPDQPVGHGPGHGDDDGAGPANVQAPADEAAGANPEENEEDNNADGGAADVMWPPETALDRDLHIDPPEDH